VINNLNKKNSFPETVTLPDRGESTSHMDDMTSGSRVSLGKQVPYFNSFSRVSVLKINSIVAG
jgi:hypothetical protein